MSGPHRPTGRETRKAAPRAAFRFGVARVNQWTAGCAVHHQAWFSCANMSRSITDTGGP